MGDFGTSIAANVLSSALWVLLGALLVKLYGVYSARRDTLFNRFAQMPQRARLVHLTYGLVGTEADGRTAKEGDVSAICSALALLLERFGPTRVSVLSPMAALSEFGTADNLFSVSGPIWIPITRALLAASPIPVSFAVTDGDDTLVDKSEGSLTVYRTLLEASIPRECYALVYRGFRETPGDEKKRHFVVAAGISPLGTYGAVTWLRKCATQRLRTNAFVKSLRKNEYALVLLRVRDNSPTGFQSYSAGPDKPGFLLIDVLAQYRAMHNGHAHDAGNNSQEVLSGTSTRNPPAGQRVARDESRSW